MITELDSFSENHLGPFFVYVNGALAGSVVKAAGGTSGFALQVFKSGDGHELGRNTLFGKVRIFRCTADVIPMEAIDGFLERYGVSRGSKT